MLSLVVVTTLVGLIALSYAWYSNEQTGKLSFNLPAQGFLILEFEEDVDWGDKVLTPAVAWENALVDNLYMDVLREYDPSDENPSYITTAATIVEYGAVLNYHNAEENQTNNEIVIKCEAYSYLPDGTKVPISLERELSVTVSAVVTDSNGQEPDYELDIVPLNTAFPVPPQSVVSLSLSCYIKLPDELCDSSLLLGRLMILVTVTSLAEAG